MRRIVKVGDRKIPQHYFLKFLNGLSIFCVFSYYFKTFPLFFIAILLQPDDKSVIFDIIGLGCENVMIERAMK